MKRVRGGYLPTIGIMVPSFLNKNRAPEKSICGFLWIFARFCRNLLSTIAYVMATLPRCGPRCDFVLEEEDSWEVALRQF